VTSSAKAAAAVAPVMLASSVPASAAEDDLIDQGRDPYEDTYAMCYGRDIVNSGTLSFDLRKLLQGRNFHIVMAGFVPRP
jgi:hypothetical protein